MEKINQTPNPEIKRSPEELAEEVKFKIAQAYERDLIGTSERIAEYTKEIRKKYPDRANYKLYHVLSGSSPKIDFPSPDSVEEFIETL